MNGYIESAGKADTWIGPIMAGRLLCHVGHAAARNPGALT